MAPQAHPALALMLMLEKPATGHILSILGPDRLQALARLTCTESTAAAALLRLRLSHTFASPPQGIRSLNSASPKRKCGTWIRLRPVR